MFRSLSTSIKKVVLNLSPLNSALSHGFEFCNPLLSVKRKNGFAEFEMSFAQISKLSPCSSDKFRNIEHGPKLVGNRRFTQSG